MIRDQKAIGSALWQAVVSRHRRASLWLGVAPAALLIASGPGLAQELPTGGTVVAGSASVSTPAAGQLAISQGSNAAVINWNSFSVGQGGTVDIHQPSSQAALLNRVTGDTTSAIHGQINANGQVFVVNPNGIFIGPNGRIETSGFVASTLDITDENFMSGRYRFEGNGSSATVENAGLIQSVPGGYAALIGGKVKNSGVIRVPLGKVGLGAGEQVTLDFTGDGFLQVAVPSEGDDMEALVENSGRIEAEGGQVHLLAASARDAARHVVNMSGVIEARSVSGRNGAVVLGGGGGAVRVSGRIDTSAKVTLVDSSPRPVARPGGEITITGTAIALEGASLDASGAGAGDGGSIRVGGDRAGQGNLQRALTTFADAATTITADGGESGNGGRIIVWSDVFTEFNGRISARGGDNAGNGGFVEVSGRDDLRYRGLTDTRAPNGATGMLLLDPGNITVGNGAGDTFTAAQVEANIELTSVTLDTTVDGSGAPGNITINEAITWSSGSTFSLNADNNIVFNAAISGSGGTLQLDAGGTITTGAGGDINVRTFRLNSGDWRQVAATLPGFTVFDFGVSSGSNFLRATGGTGTSGDPYALTDIFGVQGIGGPALRNSSFVLANDIDATGTTGWFFNGEGSDGFRPMDFGGTLDGAGFEIDGLSKFDSNVAGGLFDQLFGTALVTDLHLTNADIFSSEGGVLAFSNAGQIRNSSVDGSFRTFGQDPGAVGGMVGSNSGTIQDSFATVDVEANSNPDAVPLWVGGLAGRNDGTILRSHAAGDVTGNDFNNGANVSVGGLAGLNTGTIQSSYATGAAVAFESADGGTGRAGGLVGLNQNLIADSYSTGTSSASGFDTNLTGGLVATSSGTVNGSFWDTELSGQSTSAGGTGLITSQFQDTDGFFALASAAGWDFVNDWAPGASGQHPLNLTTSAVLFVRPDALTLQYGQTTDASTTGTIAGGPGSYVFGPAGDTLDTSGLLSDLSFADETVGSTTFVPTATSLNSAQGESYQVISLTGDATIDAAPLTITANDQTRTYGDDFSLGTTEFTTSQLFFGDQITGVTLTSEGEAQFANVADGPYAITPSDAQADEGVLSNYVVTYVDGSLTVDPAQVTVTANDLSRVYGDGFSFAGTEFTHTALVNQMDSIDSVTLASAGAAQFADVAGSPYDITPSDAQGSGVSNYTITYETGALTIIQAPLLITADTLTRTYGDGFAFTGSEFTTEGLLGSDTIGSVDLASAGAEQFADASFGEPYIVTASNAQGGDAANYSIEYDVGFLDVLQAPLTITANDQIKLAGEAFEFTGNEFSTSGLVNPADAVTTAFLFSLGADADASVDGSPYAIDFSSQPEGVGLSNYAITLVSGQFVVAPDNGILNPPPFPVVEVTPRGETEFTGEIENETEGGGGGGTAVNPVVVAEEALGTVEDVSTQFEDLASGCASEDVAEYLACLADAMDAYAKDLDAIAQGLPPGLETVGDIIKGASAGVRAAGEKAQARLALATTDAERQQIRREAVQEARAAIRTAQTEIRKAITLIRAQDPELVSLQREQVDTIVAAVGSAEIGLSRVLEL